MATKPNPAQTRLQEEQYEITVPNTGDRVAQTAAAMLLEEKLEPVFHRDSYGYRPGAQRP
jgi:retron-type reverse transcriptase